MAPLNEDEAVNDKHIVIEEIAKRRNSWFSYFFNFEPSYLQQRKSVTVQNANGSKETNVAGSMKREVGSSVDNITSCQESNNDTLEAETNEGAEPMSTKHPACKNCKLEQQKDNKMFIYKKRESDNISKQSSFSAVLMDFSPQWFKSLMRDPEFVMTGGKKAEHNDVHHSADSLFSTSSGFNNYRGLLNLCIILLVLSNARLVLENIIKYGVLIDPFQWIHMGLAEPYSWPNVALIPLANVFILTSFYTEIAVLKSYLSERTTLVIHTINLVLLLVIPAAVVLYYHPNPAFSMITLGLYTICFLKLVSYVAVNKWCRQSYSPKKKGLRRTKSVSMEGSMANGKEETMIVTYPENLNYNDLYYFMFAPTLCYELNFPRSLRIRKRFLLKRIIEMIFLSQLMLGCIQQWMFPTVHNSMKPLADMDISRSVERLLKLAIPNHFIWLMFFYWFFHSTLNVVAELLKFGDREFYKDWWNSDTVSQFWSSWNIPVHRWASRHLYKPLIRRGCPRFYASIAVFVCSAFFHEYLLSVPLRMFRIWAFSAMLGQVPLAVMQSKYLQGKWGNIVVWLSLIVGQPIAILAYFHDYYVMHATQLISANNTGGV